MREDFSEFDVPTDVLEAFPPDRDALFAEIQPWITDRLLKIVASCDYGDDTQEHYDALVGIRNGTTLSEPYGWHPGEVLQLYRWSDWGTSRDGLVEAEFHVLRAFCSYALLRVEDQTGNCPTYSNDNLARLIESCLFLGGVFIDPLLRFITYGLVSMDKWDEDFLFWFYGLIAVLALGGDRYPDLEGLVLWVRKANDQILPWHQWKLQKGATTALNIKFNGQSHDVWRNLFERVIASRTWSDDSLSFLKMLTKPPRRWWQSS